MEVEAFDESAEGWRLVLVEDRGQRWTQRATLHAVVAQCDTQTVLGDAVAVRTGDALDQAAQAQASQVVGGARRAVGGLTNEVLVILRHALGRIGLTPG